MPVSTDLVTDLPADFEVFGQAVDTQLKALNPSTTLGDIEYRSATANTNTRLGIGTTGQVLTVSGGVPAWSTISAGGMTLLSTTSLSGSSVTVSSISQSYTDLVVIVNSISNASEAVYYAKINNTGNFAGTGADTGAVRTYDGDIRLHGSGYALSSGTYPNSACITIKNYSSTSLYKPVLNFFGANYSGYGPSGGVQGGHWRDTSAVTSMVISLNTGTFTAGSVQIYGVK